MLVENGSLWVPALKVIFFFDFRLTCNRPDRPLELCSRLRKSVDAHTRVDHSTIHLNDCNPIEAHRFSIVVILNNVVYEMTDNERVAVLYHRGY